MLEVDGLTARAGDFVLRDVRFQVGAGECHAVLGPSGSGKSTLLRALLGELPLSNGRVLLAGEDIRNWPMERRRLGYLPQRLGLFPHLSVRENLAYSARARNVPRAEFEPVLDRLVEVTGIGSLLGRRPATLSGGERQRVALVRALAANPQVVLLDEPFTALHESLRRELWWLLRDLQRERGLAVLLITHDLSEAYFLAERITVLVGGQQAQSGAREDVGRRPATLAVARFLGLKNLFPGVVSGLTAGGIEADCPTLGHRFRLPGQAPVGAPVWLGIRPADVKLRGALHPPRPSERVLTGRVRLLHLGSDVVLVFSHDESAGPIEISASYRTVERLGLTDGATGVRIGLAEEAFFWVPGV